jgi:hypothetical protein
MDGRRARLIESRLHGVPTIPEVERADRPALRPRLAALGQRARAYGESRLRLGWAMALGVGWPLAFGVAVALEPTPADPQASVPAAVQAAGLVMMAGLLGTAVLAANRMRGAAVAAVVTGLVAVGLSVSCPASGHHDYGAWWFGHLGVLSAMLAVSVAALGRRASAP